MILRTAVKLFVCDQAGNILLLRRSKTHPRYALQWDVPGGFVDDGEDLKAALVRELQEEAALPTDPACMQLLYAKTDFYENGSSGDHVESVVRLYYVGHVAGVRPGVTISYEHDESAWVAPDEAMQRLTTTPFESAVQYLTEHNLLALAQNKTTV